jgi:hypothetical protein
MKIHVDMAAAGLAVVIALAFFVTKFVYPNEGPPDEGYGLMYTYSPPTDDRGIVQYLYVNEIKCGSDALVGMDRLRIGDRIVRINSRPMTWIEEKELVRFLGKLEYPSGKLHVQVERRGRQLVEFERIITPQKIEWSRNCG